MDIHHLCCLQHDSAQLSLALCNAVIRSSCLQFDQATSRAHSLCTRYFISSNRETFGCECCRVHTEFTHRSSCNTYLITTERWKINTIIMIAENYVILKAREYVKLRMSSQSKLCFGEDSKATCCKRDHCTVCSMNSPPCHSYENQGMHIESTNITI